MSEHHKIRDFQLKKYTIAVVSRGAGGREQGGQGEQGEKNTMPNSQCPMPNWQSLDIIVSTQQAAKLADEQMVTLSYVSRLALRNLLLFVCNRSQPESINVRIATESE
jgi:hypothetical protein